MRSIAPMRKNVELVKMENQKRAHYRNLLICSRVWQCPVCASTITEKRRRELTSAIVESHLYPVLLTFTLRHKNADLLPDLLIALNEAFRTMKSGRAFQEFMLEYGWKGSVRSLEVTHGDNGWHPHIHVLALLDAPLDALGESGMQKFLKDRWRRLMIKQGHDASWTYGVNLVRENDRITEYVAKFGKMPKTVSWSLEHELTKAPTKKAKLDGRTPMQLLMDYGDDDIEAGRLFVEYAHAFKGRNQLVWSRGFRALLGLGKEIPDEEAAVPDTESGLILATLTPDEWRTVVRRNAIATLAVIAGTGTEVQVFEYIAEILSGARADATA